MSNFCNAKRLIKVAILLMLMVFMLEAAPAKMVAAQAPPLPGDLGSSALPFDQEVFETRAEEIFGDVVKGYTLAVVHDGVIVGNANGGIAVDTADAPMAIDMNGSTPVNVGSTVKMVSAIALLSAFEKDPSATVDQWLDRKIIDYFPQLWRAKLQNSNNLNENAVGLVTFRHLLQHKTGVINNFIEGGVNPSEVGVVRQYNNSNIKILSYIFPYIVDAVYGSQVDAEAASQGVTASENEFFQSKLATYFGSYMQSNIFDNASVTVAPEVNLPVGLWQERLVPSCDHKTSYAGTPYFRDETWGTAGDIPLSGDINGDGINDLVVWRPDTGAWYARTLTGAIIVSNFAWGTAGDIPLVGDMNGDQKDDFVIWRPSTGRWFARSADGIVIASNLPWGVEGDIPLVGDMNGDGRDDFVIWRPATGEWFARSADGIVIARNVQWGDESDVPLVGDMDGDQQDDFVIWRPTLGEWFARSLDGVTINLGLSWGISGDTPLVGDVNGDGADDYVIFRKATNEWFAQKTSGVILFRAVKWGDADVAGTGPLVPLVSDMSGDIKENLVVYRSQNGHWSGAGRRYALGYAAKDDNGPGQPAENIAEPPGCYAQGGYWFSSLEYAGWAATFGHGNTYVSQPVKEMLFDPSTASTRDDRLGWSNFIDTQSSGFPFVFDEYNISYLPYHGGANHQFRSAFIQLPNGYYAFGTINSIDRSSEQVARGLLRAWIAAMGGTTAQGG